MPSSGTDQRQSCLGDNLGDNRGRHNQPTPVEANQRTQNSELSSFLGFADQEGRQPHRAFEGDYTGLLPQTAMAIGVRIAKGTCCAGVCIEAD